MYTAITAPRLVLSGDPRDFCPFTLPIKADSVQEGRALRKAFQEYLIARFKEGYSVAHLLSLRTDFVDQLLQSAFERFKLSDFPELCLTAVGGYGRSELFLRSDIDILICADAETISEECQAAIEPFISFLWDLNLDIGSSVRTIKQTLEACAGDLTIKTNLIERRFICGNPKAYEHLSEALDHDPVWTPRKFLLDKLNEQIERHHEYKDTAYLLEPDVKNNPGGLRDIAIMQWIANFHFKAKTLGDMLKLGLLSASEYDELISARDFLWNVRYALHSVINRPDNRLTLDRQQAVAQVLGYGDEGNKPVENFMRAFFRTVRRVRELNSMALQLETLRITGHLGMNNEPRFLDSNFIQRGPLIDIADPELFHNHPSAMVDIFRVIAQHPEIVGLHVNCLRRLRDARRRLNNYLVEIPACRSVFKKILQSRAALTKALPLMHEHRMISAYMPQWESIEGLMQFDMFHTFTVDEHIIRVLKNIHDLNDSKDPSLNLFKQVYHQCAEPELLNPAAFLHDIAKGRGGGHAQKGAREALYFCELHGYTQYQTRLISWLVRNHLTMSATAQRRDISDPEVIAAFAEEVKDEEHLNLLYCLTVADIAATNDHEWSSWKDSMFRQLYFAVRQALRHGLEKPQDLKLHAEENQAVAMQLLPPANQQTVRTFWQNFPDYYFIHYSALELAWHARNILNFNYAQRPLILFAQHGNLGTEVFFYLKSSTFNFGAIATVMALKQLNVQSAQMMNNKGYSLCTIKLQTKHGTELDPDRLQPLRSALIKALTSAIPPLKLPHSSAKTVFKLPTIINFLSDSTEKRTNLEISALDTPGLLAKISITLDSCGCLIHAARITTTGERADDFFSVTDRDGQALTPEHKAQLAYAIRNNLDPKSTKSS